MVVPPRKKQLKENCFHILYFANKSIQLCSEEANTWKDFEL